MKSIPAVNEVAHIHMNKDPYLDAWVYNIMVENNLEHFFNPSIVASPEQLRFMVALEDDEIYMPCSDAMFHRVLKPDFCPELQKHYNRAWRIMMRIVRSSPIDKTSKLRIIQFCRLRFTRIIRQKNVIPSRLIKRLISVLLSQEGFSMLWNERKMQSNKQSEALLANAGIQRALQRLPQIEHLSDDIAQLRWECDIVSLQRHLFLASMGRKWITELPSPLSLEEEFKQACVSTVALKTLFGSENEPCKKILYLCDADGGAILDIAVIKTLLRMGHQVIYALKEEFYFYAPTIWDMEHDDVLSEHMEGAFILTNPAVSKNELLRHLREHRFVVISDGTRERMNLHRVSVTFSRAWKECDVIIARGWRSYATFGKTKHDFTRDIVLSWSDADGYHVLCKPRAKGTRKFSEHDLLQHADAIIEQMRHARDEGKTVMFYSCIIGSIPGQTKTAISVVNSFVKHLRERLDASFIINPAEHFVEGMDGDDLMFMWERVQRSGLIDVWRFQTVEDIETSFALMGRRVPAVWSGKDSTFSTGCTKEMHIALDVQHNHRELQIIGPSADKFFRRRDYGVGKYFDVGISGCGVAHNA